MIAGVGGASLGTEVVKCLKLAGGYDIFGCDISPTAYGLYLADLAKSYRVAVDGYAESVIEACRNSGAEWVIPGGEQPTALLGAAAEELGRAGVGLVANDPNVVALCSNKDQTFQRLRQIEIPAPKTSQVRTNLDVEEVGLPCIVKPATGSGGSASVFFATSVEEALTYADLIRRSGGLPIAQEYLDADEGEFTVGVLSAPTGTVIGSIAMRRTLEAKLSVLYRGRGGVISSGYSQGFIDAFPGIALQAERIAAAIGSKGPLNVQGRMRDGTLLPFEINPRFSASAYLRAMAGFNEVDLFLKHLVSGLMPTIPPLRSGWYLRSLTEMYVPSGEIR